MSTTITTTIICIFSIYQDFHLRLDDDIIFSKDSCSGVAYVSYSLTVVSDLKWGLR